MSQGQSAYIGGGNMLGNLTSGYTTATTTNPQNVITSTGQIHFDQAVPQPPRASLVSMTAKGDILVSTAYGGGVLIPKEMFGDLVALSEAGLLAKLVGADVEEK